MKTSIKNFVFAAILAISTGATAEISLIIHPGNDSAIDAKTASKIFLGKAKKFPGGGVAVPIEQPAGTAAHEEFNSNITHKTAAQLKSYWSRIVFTGKGQPPKVVDTDADVIALISKNPSMIGYVESSAVNSMVKVVLTAP
ncbi:MAG: phosphate ABC transporter substrate-binding protein [Pseudomonadales bacterium]|nr:phosphate ABC transporter substrate-binding protein [Pseudomonadales bacterium]